VKRSGPLRRYTRLVRRKPLNAMSANRRRVAPLRAALVASELALRPRCEVCGIKPSGTLHEKLTRARGGSILDPENTVAVCVGPGSCHDRIHDNPAWATEMGLLRHSWE
jgi:hypothetical protein